MTAWHTVDPTQDPRWEALTDGQHGSLFTSPLWLRALKATYGFDFTARVGLDDAVGPVSGLAWTEVHDLRGRRVVSLPFCDYADPILLEPSHWDALGEALFSSGVPVRARTLSGAGFADDKRLRPTKDTGWHAIDLTRGLDEMWDSIDQSARRAIRKAEKSGVTVRRATDLDDVRCFYDMHCATRRYKYHMLTQPFVLLEALWHQFSPSGRFALLLAELNDKVVGGTLYLEWGDTLYYKLNASWVDGLMVRPNDLLVWSGMQLGHERGLARFDFGQSDLDQEGLMRYKEKYATEQAIIRAYAYDPEGWTEPAAQIGGATLEQLTALFVQTDVPEATYREAGALLYRNFC